MIKVMVYRPTIFEVEAKNFKEAKEIILNRLIETKQMKPSDPIYFGEITDGIVTNDEDNKNDKIISSASSIEELSDGYHTFNELYDFRREYNAALVNTGVWKAHKSHRHHNGELCFGGGWFIVMIDTPFGQISNHYENKYWNEFHCEEKEVADEWDGHTEKDVLNRLYYSNKNWNK